MPNLVENKLNIFFIFKPNHPQPHDIRGKWLHRALLKIKNLLKVINIKALISLFNFQLQLFHFVGMIAFLSVLSVLV